MSASLTSLEFINKIVLHKLISIKEIRSIFGIGSFFTKQDRIPNDLDYCVKLNKRFQDLDLKQISKIFEYIKDNYKNEKSESLVNIFIEDDRGDKLNSVDLWFINNFKGETLSGCITSRKNQIWKGKQSILLFSRDE